MRTHIEPEPHPTQMASEDGGGRDAISRLWVGLGAAFGLLAVIAGAVGTHALRDSLDADALRIFGTAAQFQMYHALALVGTGLLAAHWRSRALTLAGTLFALGTLLFSGSLYALALSGVGAFGAVAPIGGVSLMAGWACLLAAAIARQGRKTAGVD